MALLASPSSGREGCGYPGCEQGYLAGRYFHLRPCPVCEQRRAYAEFLREEQPLAPQVPSAAGMAPMRTSLFEREGCAQEIDL